MEIIHGKKKCFHAIYKLTRVEGSKGEFIGWPFSGFRLSFTISKISETPWRSKPNFMWSILRKCVVGGGGGIPITGQGHMAKMATMAINSKNLKKSSASEPEGL